MPWGGLSSDATSRLGRNSMQVFTIRLLVCKLVLVSLVSCKSTQSSSVPIGTKYPIPHGQESKYIDYGATTSKSGQRSSDYLVKDSIVKRDGVVTADILSNEENPKSVDGTTKMSTILTMDFDCSSRKARISKVTGYTEVFAAGRVVNQANMVDLGLGPWVGAPKGTRFGWYLDDACELSEQSAASKNQNVKNKKTIK